MQQPVVATTPASAEVLAQPATRGATFRAKLRALLLKNDIVLEGRSDWQEFCDSYAAELDSPPEVNLLATGVGPAISGMTKMFEHVTDVLGGGPELAAQVSALHQEIARLQDELRVTKEELQNARTRLTATEKRLTVTEETLSKTSDELKQTKQALAGIAEPLTIREIMLTLERHICLGLAPSKNKAKNELYSFAAFRAQQMEAHQLERELRRLNLLISPNLSIIDRLKEQGNYVAHERPPITTAQLIAMLEDPEDEPVEKKRKADLIQALHNFHMVAADGKISTKSPW